MLMAKPCALYISCIYNTMYIYIQKYVHVNVYIHMYTLCICIHPYVYTDPCCQIQKGFQLENMHY